MIKFFNYLKNKVTGLFKERTTWDGMMLVAAGVVFLMFTPLAKKLYGYDVFLMTGTDEHGQKVQQAATKREVDPQTHVDEKFR